ncbi:MAG TPA: hypothetical protein VNP04_05920 [Alphaproteobacteria bacterium]|nr:hypothetical protein [Alphaproteobacteria bacterium]
MHQKAHKRASLTIEDLPARELPPEQAEAVRGGSWKMVTTDIVDPLEGEIASHNTDPDGNEDIDRPGPAQLA